MQSRSGANGTTLTMPSGLGTSTTDGLNCDKGSRQVVIPIVLLAAEADKEQRAPTRSPNRIEDPESGRIATTSVFRIR